ncbi:disulfide isomerase [Escherichia coli]
MTPVLCKKEAQRRVPGCNQRYPAKNGIMTPQKEKTPADETCLKAARAAIDVNNVAFRKFGFAGTPWVLSDTGWHLPTGILQETGTLNLFLKTTDSESGHE